MHSWPAHYVSNLGFSSEETTVRLEGDHLIIRLRNGEVRFSLPQTELTPTETLRRAKYIVSVPHFERLLQTLDLYRHLR